MNKDTFIFYRDWYEYIEEDIEQDLRLRVYQAIARYAFMGEEPQEQDVRRVFGFIRRQLDRDSDKYQRVIEKRREAGRKGAAKTNEIRWGESQQESAKSANADICQQESAKSANADICQQESAKSAVNGNDNDNGNEFKETPKGGKEKPQVPAEAVASTPPKVPSAIETFDTRRQEFYNSLIGYVQYYGKEMIRTFYDYWSEPNKSRSKMRWEMEKTWDLRRRLVTWSNRENKYKQYGNNRAGVTKEQMFADAAELVEELLAGDE